MKIIFLNKYEKMSEHEICVGVFMHKKISTSYFYNAQVEIKSKIFTHRRTFANRTKSKLKYTFV